MMSRSNTARPGTATKIRISSSSTGSYVSKDVPRRTPSGSEEKHSTEAEPAEEYRQHNVQAISEYVTEDSLREASGCDDLNAVEYIELQADTAESSLTRLGQLLPNLRELKMVSSSITTIRDLGTSLGNLQVLWMSKCNLSDLNGISMLTSLRELYVSFNNITECSPLSMVENLEVLDLEGNLIKDTSQVEFLSLLPQLRSLSLDGNPLLKSYPTMMEYRKAVIEALPSLSYLDDVGRDEVVAETGDTTASLLIPTLLKKRPDTAQDPGVRESVRPGTARPGTQQRGARPQTAVAGPHRDASGASDDEGDQETDASSSLTHGSKVAFQGAPLKALLARRKQTTANTEVDGTPLETLMMSVGLTDEEGEEVDPFENMSREEVFEELRGWREKFAALSAEEVAKKATEVASKQAAAEEAERAKPQSTTASPRRRPETARPARSRRVPAPPSAASLSHTQGPTRRQPVPPPPTAQPGRGRVRPAPPGIQRPQTTAGPRVRRLRSMPGRRLPALRPQSGTVAPSSAGSSLPSSSRRAGRTGSGSSSSSSGGVGGGGGGAGDEGPRHLPQPPGTAPRPGRRPNRSAHL